MAPGCVPSSLQTNLLILAAEAKRERVLHTTPKEKKAVANEERIYNSHLGLLRSERCLLDTTQLTRHVVRPTSLCHHLSNFAGIDGGLLPSCRPLVQNGRVSESGLAAHTSALISLSERGTRD